MTTITAGSVPLLVSHLGPVNPLPIFRWQQPTALQTAPPSQELSAEELAGTFTWGADSILPYQVQDDYDRAQQPGNLDAIIVENDHLRLVFFPQFGGRLASIVNKADGRELLFRNPVFQPANLASLNAWFSGGIEWNGLIPGHSPFTCSPVFAATVESDRGPVLRLYEFDRKRESAWQLDLFLPEDQSRIWIHVSLINPNSRAVPCYWWTNIAAPLDESTRVLSPADYSIEHVLPDNHLAPFAFPNGHNFDGSYPGNYRDSASVFFRKPGRKRPWIAAIQGNGEGLFETSTATLEGRKLFAWGSGPVGRRWSDFLSLPGQGAYIELQAGVTPTQNQEFMLDGGETLAWTESIAPVSIAPQIGHDPNYHAACAAMEELILAQVPDSVLADVDGWMTQLAAQPVGEILSRGRAWGMLHERMTGSRISAGLDFTVEPKDEACWAELLVDGKFSAATLMRSPSSWAVSDRWLDVLLTSRELHGTTWLHELFLGVAALDRERVGDAQTHFERSQALQKNYLAHRHLALIDTLSGDPAAAWAHYQRAWEESEHSTQLAVEICRFLRENGMPDELVQFVKQLPPESQSHERIRLAQAQVALAEGDYQQVLAILDGDFATVREGETLLTDLWFAAHRLRAEEAKGEPLSPAEAVEVDRQYPPPQRIDFRMKIEIKSNGG